MHSVRQSGEDLHSLIFASISNRHTNHLPSKAQNGTELKKKKKLSKSRKATFSLLKPQNWMQKYYWLLRRKGMEGRGGEERGGERKKRRKERKRKYCLSWKQIHLQLTVN